MDLIFNRLPYDSIEEIGPAKIYFGAVGVCLILFLISFFTFVSAVSLEHETLMKKIVDKNILKLSRASMKFLKT